MFKKYRSKEKSLYGIFIFRRGFHRSCLIRILFRSLLGFPIRDDVVGALVRRTVDHLHDRPVFRPKSKMKQKLRRPEKDLKLTGFVNSWLKSTVLRTNIAFKSSFTRLWNS